MSGTKGFLPQVFHPEKAWLGGVVVWQCADSNQEGGR